MFDLTVISNAAKNLGRTIDHNSPTILTALGVGGLITTVILAVKATPKALEALERERVFRYSEYGEDRDLEPLEVVDTTWRFYIPTAAMGLVTIGCIIGSNHISLRRNAALASLFSITETTMREYQEKVKEQIGEKKEEKIRSEIAQEKLDRNPNEEKTVILTGNGQYLCFDVFSSRYFRSDIESLRKAQNQFNQKLLREGWLAINEFYYDIGLEPIELGDEMGWIAERDLLEMRFDTKMAKGSNEPCLVVGYTVMPHHI